MADTATGNDFIGTAWAAPGMAYAAEAAESWQYYHGAPYPRYAFGPQQWPVDKGPHPTPLPYAKMLVDEGAEFLFRGGPPTFTVGDNPDAEALLALIIRRNKLAARYVPLAVLAGNQGTLAVKFAYLPDAPSGPIRLSFFSVPQECRVWLDPHDQTRTLMARIQYPYRDPATGCWFYFREEWTDTLHVSYAPLLAGDASVASSSSLPSIAAHFGDGAGEWVQSEVKENPFGLVPVTLIRNKHKEGSPLGTGDCWGEFRLMDRIALTMHGEDRSNQQHSEPREVFLNASLENVAPTLPGEPISINNQNPDAPPADYKLVEPNGAAREYSYRAIDKWEQLLYAAAGLSRVDPATIGNKGNLTRLALMTAYARTVATSDRKRTSWGQDGLACLFTNVLVALSRIGGEVQGVDDDVQVECQWPDYFEETAQDTQDASTRTIAQVGAGLLPAARGAERLALREGIPPAEVPALLEELAAERADNAAKQAMILQAKKEQAASEAASEAAALSPDNQSAAGSEDAFGEGLGEGATGLD